MLSQLRDIDLQLLRLFVTIVDCGGFSAAQGELGIAQSTISTQMARLETRLGFRLCERGKSGFRLTAKGGRVLLSTRRMLAAIDEFRQEAREVSDILLGDLHIGITEFLDRQILERIASAIGVFRRRNQAVTIELITATPAELERRLLQDRLQIAIGYFSGQQNSLNYKFLFEERQVLYCGEGHPLFSAPPMNIDDLVDADIVKHPYKINRGGDRLHSARQTALSEQVDADLIFILSGAHIGFLPEHAARPWVEQKKLRALLEPELGYNAQFQLATSRAHAPSEALKAFIHDLLPKVEPSNIRP